MNYYEILEIDKSASLEEIKKAFKNLAKKYHPDNKETGNSEKMSQLNEAYSILKDKTLRNKYEFKCN